MDDRPTKRRDLVIFFVALLVVAYIFRDGWIFIFHDKGDFLVFDAEYDEYLVAADKVHPRTSAIQDECNQVGFCPESPAGWMRRTDSFESVSGDLVYAPIRSRKLSYDEKLNTFQTFEVTYDYSPGWQLFAYGGVGIDLTLERRQRGQGIE